MSIKGGYKLINLKNTDLTNASPTTIDGIYESIENSYRKPLVLTGLVIDHVEKPDTWINFYVDMGKFKASILNGTLEVSAENEVTFTKNV